MNSALLQSLLLSPYGKDVCTKCGLVWGSDVLRDGICPDCVAGEPPLLEVAGTSQEVQDEMTLAHGKQWHDI